MYNYGEYIKASSHYCPDYLKERMKLLNKIRCIAPNSLDWNNAQLTEILLFGRGNLDNMNNGSILDVTIKRLIETKRFDAKLFLMLSRCMALTLILLSKFIFLFFVCFIVISFLLISIFFCFVCFFVPRHITTHYNTKKITIIDILRNLFNYTRFQPHEYTLRKKWSFSLRISSVNVTISAVSLM